MPPNPKKPRIEESGFINPQSPTLNPEFTVLQHVIQKCMIACYGQVDKMGVSKGKFDEKVVTTALQERQGRGELSDDWAYAKTTFYKKFASDEDYKEAHDKFVEAFKGAELKSGTTFFVGYGEFGQQDKESLGVDIPDNPKVKKEEEEGVKNQLTRSRVFDNKADALTFMNGLQSVLDSCEHHSNNVVTVLPNGKVRITLEMHTHGAKGGPGLTVADFATCALVDAYIKYPTLESGLDALQQAQGDKNSQKTIMRQLLYVYDLEHVKDPKVDSKIVTALKAEKYQDIKKQADLLFSEVLDQAKALYLEENYAGLAK